MQKRLIPAFILIAYSAILIKIMVFKDLPLIRVGSLMLNFGGTDGGHPANLLPFTTIVPYLLGDKGWIIAGINLVGNIVPLVPIGFLAPFIYSHMTWKKSLILAVASGLVIETMQVVLHVGIFDIDDVILNALGVMIGYWIFALLAAWMRPMTLKNKIITAIAGCVIVAAAAVAYQSGPLAINLEAAPSSNQAGPGGSTEGGAAQGRDLCGGTGGNGQIVSVGNSSFVMKQKDGRNQIVNLTGQATIKTSAGPASKSDLKIGDRITLVGGPNPDGSFTAEAVFVCSATGPGTQ